MATMATGSGDDDDKDGGDDDTAATDGVDATN